VLAESPGALSDMSEGVVLNVNVPGCEWGPARHAAHSNLAAACQPTAESRGVMNPSADAAPQPPPNQQVT
jgi:hypothetical protein